MIAILLKITLIFNKETLFLYLISFPVPLPLIRVKRKGDPTNLLTIIPKVDFTLELTATYCRRITKRDYGGGFHLNTFLCLSLKALKKK